MVICEEIYDETTLKGGGRNIWSPPHPPIPGPVWSDEELICSVCHNLQTNPASSSHTSSLPVTEGLKIESQTKDPLVGPKGSASGTEFVLWGVKVQPSWDWPTA